jgi:hypothetical protein
MDHVAFRRLPKMLSLPSNRCLSSAATNTYAISTDLNSKLRNLVKPFLLKCHPDVHVATANKKINMTAIQNLNAYLDTIQSIAIGKHVSKQSENGEGGSIVEIDFIIAIDGSLLGRKVKKKVAMANYVNGTSASLVNCRRKVELSFPPRQLCVNLANHVLGGNDGDQHPRLQQLRYRLLQHCRQELVKLLRIAGLEVPIIDDSDDVPYDENDLIMDGFIAEAEEPSDYQRYAPPPQNETGFRRAHYVPPVRRATITTRPKNAYEKARDRFTSKIQWHNFDRLYRDAVAGMNAEATAEGLISKNPKRRRAMIARILANVRLRKPEAESTASSRISFAEELVAFRRLSLLFDRHFDELQMEDFGAMWESSRIILTDPRPYNTSQSALQKRKASHLAEASGFSFALHPDHTVTITIPIDFHDEELIEELDQNVWDFYDFVGDGTEDFFSDLTNEI